MPKLSFDNSLKKDFLTLDIQKDLSNSSSASERGNI